MRSVCGCISASSAATEIMNTPRSWSTRAVTRVRRTAPISSGSAGSSEGPLPPRLAQDPLARVAVHHLRELVDRAALLVGEVARHVDHEPVAQIALAVAARHRRALAA